jgi:glycolate oxidase FAD binding subunit
MTATLAPRDEAELIRDVTASFEAGTPLEVFGHGSKRGLLRPVQAARGLSTTAMSGISLYSPQELILSAGAGTTLAEIEAAVAERGQQITSEPPDFSSLLGVEAAQTFGGVVGANLSGPRRVAWGATRDHVLGVRAVNGRGELVRSGGRVLKNVTGLDICKLLTGSHGTLAVMSEITIKVLPAAERRGTVLLAGLDAVKGVAALSAALGSPYAVSGAAYLPAEAAQKIPALAWLGGAVALVRIEDFAQSVTYRTNRLRAGLAEFGQAELLDDAASVAAWAAVRDAAPLHGGDGAIWRVSVRPSAGPQVVETVARAFPARWFLDWGGGLVWIAGPATEGAHSSVVAAAQAAGGTFMLLRAPEGLRASVPVIPPEPAALARITASVKAAFDPKGILNPGRMYAGV